mmetsp:Transcript_80817/g.203206  ORF Transcript_80817/g.203206 Transcript_80817/m.203206 type:complete len:225 (+) Transcript_80817:654-1328(+)
MLGGRYFTNNFLGESPSSRKRLACCCLRKASSFCERSFVMIQRLAFSTRSSASSLLAYFFRNLPTAFATLSRGAPSSKPKIRYMRVHSLGLSLSDGDSGVLDQRRISNKASCCAVATAAVPMQAAASLRAAREPPQKFAACELLGAFLGETVANSSADGTPRRARADDATTTRVEAVPRREAKGEQRDLSTKPRAMARARLRCKMQRSRITMASVGLEPKWRPT